MASKFKEDESKRSPAKFQISKNRQIDESIKSLETLKALKIFYYKNASRFQDHHYIILFK